MRVDPKSLKIYQGTGEWSALYRDGVLEYVGDHYLIEERVYSLLGIEVEQTDDFMRGGGSAGDVAHTVEDLLEFRTEREANEQRLAELEAEARELSQRIKAMRKDLAEHGSTLPPGI